jgi:esterase/lipase superfamily enzyme
MKKHYILASIILAIVVISLVVSTPTAYATPPSDTTTKQQQPLLSIISTRDTPIFTPAHLTKLVSDTMTKFDKNKTCPSDIAIYIHGFNKSKDDAGEEFNRIQTSLNVSKSPVPLLIGFSWNSKVPWEQAKVNAENSGAELVKFILVFKYQCQTTNIHLVAHSLGAEVVDSTLRYLDTYLNDKVSKNNPKIINSVHLLGAAINNLSIAKGTPLGDAIENIVGKFYNLYNPEDDGLQFNKFFEKHNPLGLVGAPKGTIPLNYNDTNVINEILAISDADGDGNLEECFEEYSVVLKKGDNHCGYIGFRQPFSNSLIDNGAINIVVEEWLKH